MSATLDPWQVIGDDFLTGYLSGYLAGVERGREQADEEAAALHHKAFQVVQAAAKMPTHDELEEGRRRRTRDATERYRTDEPWPETAPIARGSRDASGYGPGVRIRGQGLPSHRYDADGTYVTTGWPLEEPVWTPAEQAWRAAQEASRG